jgi:hypothetical protein
MGRSNASIVVRRKNPSRRTVKKGNGFVSFLDSRDVVLNAVIFIASLSINRFTQRFVEVCFTGIITSTTGLTTLKYKLSDSISLDIGALALDLINLVIVLYFAYLLLRYSEKWLGWI